MDGASGVWTLLSAVANGLEQADIALEGHLWILIALMSLGAFLMMAGLAQTPEDRSRISPFVYGVAGMAVAVTLLMTR